MQVLDDHGRLFGRINIIDAAVLFVACLMIPLAYGAYLLFSTPPARIISIEPAHASQGLSQITIRGEHLRPYLRVGIGKQEAALLFENAALGILPLPRLDPGSYDVVLYDESQELQRLVGGLVIEAPVPPAVPHAELIVSGAFRGLGVRAAGRLVRNLGTATQDHPWGRVLGFQPAEVRMAPLQPGAVVMSDGTYQVRAVIRLRCALEGNECRLENVAVKPAAEVPIAVAGQTTNFTIDDVHPADARDVQVTLRAAIPPELTAFLSAAGEGGERFPAWDALRPSLVSFTLQRRVPDGRDVGIAVVRVPAVRTATGWLYRERVLRVSEEFSFEGPQYQLRGVIAGIAAAGAPGINAPTIPAVPQRLRTELIASGAFRDLDVRAADTLVKDLSTARQDHSWGRVLGFQPAEVWMASLQPGAVVMSDGTYQVRAVIRLRCVLDGNECRLENAAVKPGGEVLIAVAGQTTNFAIDEVHPADTRDVQVTLRAAVPPEVTEFLQSPASNDGGRFPAWDALRPSLVSFTLQGRIAGWNDPATVVFRVPAVRTAEGWLYRGSVLRIGEDFSFEGPLYRLRGVIMGIAPSR